MAQNSILFILIAVGLFRFTLHFYSSKFHSVYINSEKKYYYLFIPIYSKFHSVYINRQFRCNIVPAKIAQNSILFILIGFYVHALAAIRQTSKFHSVYINSTTAKAKCIVNLISKFHSVYINRKFSGLINSMSDDSKFHSVYINRQ